VAAWPRHGHDRGRLTIAPPLGTTPTTPRGPIHGTPHGTKPGLPEGTTHWINQGTPTGNHPDDTWDFFEGPKRGSPGRFPRFVSTDMSPGDIHSGPHGFSNGMFPLGSLLVGPLWLSCVPRGVLWEGRLGRGHLLIQCGGLLVCSSWVS
jgi:hypothetical protein